MASLTGNVAAVFIAGFVSVLSLVTISNFQGLEAVVYIFRPFSSSIMDGSTFLASISALGKEGGPSGEPEGVAATTPSSRDALMSRLKREEEGPTRIQFNGEIDTFPIRGHPQVIEYFSFLNG